MSDPSATGETGATDETPADLPEGASRRLQELENGLFTSDLSVNEFLLIKEVGFHPLGFVMGMPFPTGLKRLEEWHAPSVRWAWSLNAASSVLGSVGALVCAIYLGLIQTLVIGGLFYLAALAVVARVSASDTPVPEPAPGRVVLGH